LSARSDNTADRRSTAPADRTALSLATLLPSAFGRAVSMTHSSESWAPEALGPRPLFAVTRMLNVIRRCLDLGRADVAENPWDASAARVAVWAAR
jgi:hypothetical protein